MFLEAQNMAEPVLEARNMFLEAQNMTEPVISFYSVRMWAQFPFRIFKLIDVIF
jgi:hypothetical protein